MDQKDTSRNSRELELISTSVDDELSEFEIHKLSKYLQNHAPTGEWENYHMISDVLQGHFPRRIRKDFASRVMASIAKEQILPGEESSEVPAKRHRKGLKYLAQFAVAASVAAVVITIHQQTDVGDSGLVEQPLALEEVSSDEIPQIMATSEKDNSSQLAATASYPVINPVDAQLVKMEESERSSVIQATTSDFKELDPYIMNHAGVASERLLTPFMAQPRLINDSSE